MKTLIKYVFITLLTVLLFSSCARNPVTGGRDFVTMTEAQEISLGKQSDPSIVAEFGLYDDAKIQQFINQKGQEMAKISHRPNLKFTFRVVDSPMINAFALPGGYVYFTRGILAHFNNEAEFAGVLGHEIGHVTARHGVKAQSRQALGNIGMIGGVIFAPKIMSQVGGQLQQALGLAFLKYGRDDESQSDKLGVEYSTKIHYNSKYMADFFKTLHRISSKNGQETNTMLSTHPDPLDRYSKVSQLTTEWQQKTNGPYKVNRNQYLQMIDGLLYGENPRNGFTKNGTFYHPELKFKFRIPNSWRLQNEPSRVVMVNSKQNAGLIFSLSKGNNPKTAAEQFINQAKVQVENSSQTMINGSRAFKILGNVISTNQQGQSTKQPIYAYFIARGGHIYQFLGFAEGDQLSSFIGAFNQSINSFDGVSDPSILNVQPEKIAIVTVKSDMPLIAALKRNGIKANRIEEFAILNGMNQKDIIKKGTLIKVLK